MDIYSDQASERGKNPKTQFHCCMNAYFPNSQKTTQENVLKNLKILSPCRFTSQHF